MAEAVIYWEGSSGKKYPYSIYKLGTTFYDVPGNYMYARETKPNYCLPVYIGQSASLAERLADHEKEDCARRNGATHIHAHKGSDSEQVRRAEETDLIDKWHPVCND